MLPGKTLLTYCALVGVPLLALSGILSYGRSLSAPVAIAGTWTVESAMCQCTAMEVRQSGEEVTAVLNDRHHTTMTSIVHGRELTGEMQGVVAGGGAERRIEAKMGTMAFTAVLLKKGHKGA